MIKEILSDRVFQYYMKVLVIFIIIVILLIRHRIKRKRFRKLCRISTKPIYKYIYGFEIGLSNGEVIKIVAYSDYKDHSCESFKRYYGNIHKEGRYYNLWHNGGSFQIMEEHISFERIQIIGENDYGS